MLAFRLSDDEPDFALVGERKVRVEKEWVVIPLEFFCQLLEKARHTK